jgi:hypothetical protein
MNEKPDLSQHDPGGPVEQDFERDALAGGIPGPTGPQGLLGGIGPVGATGPAGPPGADVLALLAALHPADQPAAVDYLNKRLAGLGLGYRLTSLN